MTQLKMTSGSFEFIVQMEEGKAPESCKWFLTQLPFKTVMIQGAWSGNAVFSDLNGIAKEVPYESATSYPIPGQILLYSGDEKGNTGEIYIAYGGNRFACPRGQLAGNHFLTIEKGGEQLQEFGRTVRWNGAQEIVFELMED